MNIIMIEGKDRMLIYIMDGCRANHYPGLKLLNCHIATELEKVHL